MSEEYMVGDSHSDLTAGSLSEIAVRLGVVIPTFNSASKLRNALLSVKEQRGCGASVVVADSGSSDGTLEICADYGVETIYVPAGNMYRAINAGVRRCDADWVAYLNSDDFVYPDTYRRLITQGITSGADIVYGNGDYVDVDGRFLYSLVSPSPSDLTTLFKGMLFGFMPHASVFRKRVFDDLNGFDESFRHISDFEFFGRACFAGKKFAALDAPSVAAFRIHAEQLSTRETSVAAAERQHLRTRWQGNRVLTGAWAMGKWKVSNFRHYLLRWLRTGSLRRAR